MQATALGDLGSLGDARAVLSASFSQTSYEPGTPPEWREAKDRFASLLRTSAD